MVHLQVVALVIDGDIPLEKACDLEVLLVVGDDLDLLAANSSLIMKAPSRIQVPRKSSPCCSM